MDANSFQSTYPLSPKKWWKKMIPKVPLAILFGIFAGGFVTIMLAVILESLGEASRGKAFAAAGTIILATVIGFVLLLIAYGFYVKAYIRTYFYSADDQFVTIKKGVFAPREIHVQYQKIQDVYVDQDLLDRVLGLYDVHLASATAASSMEAHIDGVEQTAADGLKKFLLDKIVARGSGTPTATPPAASVDAKPAAPPAAVPDVSSTAYPIAAAWFVTSGIGTVFTSFILAFVFGFNVMAGIEDSPAAGFFVVLALAIVFSIIGVIWLQLWKRSFSWSFAPDFFLIKEGVVSRKETHLPYGTIQDVILEQSVFERLFGISTVRIENAAAGSMPAKNARQRGIRLPGQPLAKGQALVEIIRSVAMSHRQSTGL